MFLRVRPKEGNSSIPELRYKVISMLFGKPLETKGQNDHLTTLIGRGNTQTLSAISVVVFFCFFLKQRPNESLVKHVVFGLLFQRRNVSCGGASDLFHCSATCGFFMESLAEHGRGFKTRKRQVPWRAVNLGGNI